MTTTVATAKDPELAAWSDHGAQAFLRKRLASAVTTRLSLRRTNGANPG